MNEIDLSVKYQAKTDETIKHYNSLVAAVRKYLFPWNFKAADALPNISNWSNRRKTLLIFVIPFAIFDSEFEAFLNDSKSIPGILLAICSWLLYFLITYSLGIETFVRYLGIIPPSISPTQSVSVFTLWVVLSLLILIGIMSLIVYAQNVFYWFNKKTNGKNKLIYILSIFLTAYILFLQIQNLAGKPITISLHLPQNIIFVFIMPIFVWIPFLLFFASIALVIAKFIINLLLQVYFYFSKVYYSTDYSEFTKKIIFEPIETSSGNWLLMSLPSSEIRVLKAWGQNNLSITEKKTIPTITFFTILGILITYAPLQNKLSDILEDFFVFFGSISNQRATSFEQFLLGIGAIFIAYLFWLIPAGLFIIYIKILAHLFIQAIVIEVCIVAEYTKSEIEKEIAQKRQLPSPWQAMLKWLFGKD